MSDPRSAPQPAGSHPGTPGEARSWETPDADAAEQEIPVTAPADDEPAGPDAPRGPEVDEADAAEQAAEVPLDEEEYR